MPFKPKFTQEEIAELYEEWKNSGLTLKEFCGTYTPTPLPYTTIFRRFQRLKGYMDTPIKIKKSITQPIEKEIASDLIQKASREHKIFFEVGKDICVNLQNYVNQKINEIYIKIGKTITPKIRLFASKKGWNPKYLTEEQILALINENIDYIITICQNKLEKLTSLKITQFFLRNGRYPKSFEELQEI